MKKMKSLSVLALTLMLTGVLAACGNNQEASPIQEQAPTNTSDETTGDISREDNDAHPTNEVDIDKEDSSDESTDSAVGEAQETTDLDPTTGDPATTDNGSTDSTPADTKTEEPADSTDKGTTPSASAPTTEDDKTGRGAYIGLADGHTAEIEVSGNPVMYQLSEEAQTQLGKISENANVEFTYTEEDFDSETKVMTITEIKEAK
ncbi:hypothetical protein [Saccharibacillus sp. JS10]|uniref:hypothetical protein n=1 Tax=Saccharibacillus sp. JS10 TaxID=2950552 RepID=UPI00210C9DAB|nr:hypothetical protein [Saccharibacillus sp. JS10]MCQ4086603.1 hypothetical protein [Saccharibacillus sp. JS10]